MLFKDGFGGAEEKNNYQAGLLRSLIHFSIVVRASYQVPEIIFVTIGIILRLPEDRTGIHE